MARPPYPYKTWAAYQQARPPRRDRQRGPALGRSAVTPPERGPWWVLVPDDFNDPPVITKTAASQGQVLAGPFALANEAADNARWFAVSEVADDPGRLADVLHRLLQAPDESDAQAYLATLWLASWDDADTGTRDAARRRYVQAYGSRSWQSATALVDDLRDSTWYRRRGEARRRRPIRR